MSNVGVVGAGLMGWAHTFGLQTMIDAGVIDASVVSVHDVDSDKAAGLAALSRATVASSVAQLVERCEAVWVCTPTAFHRQVVEEAAAAGRAVFCEKPLAPNLSEAQAVAGAVSGRVPSQVGLVLRSAPVFKALRQVISSGELGPPMTAVLRDDQYFPVQGMYASGWRAEVEVAGGGCLIEHSIHDVDILRWCMGEVVEVTAKTSNFSGHRGIEDLAVVTLQFESGATAQIVSVWHQILSRGSTRRLEVFCRDGMAWIDNDSVGPVHVETSHNSEVRACPPPSWLEELELGAAEGVGALGSYMEADRAFVDALSSGRPPEPDLEVAVAAHRIVDAAYRSALRHGAPVGVQE